MTKTNARILMAAVMVARGTSFIFSKTLMGSMGALNILGLRFLTAFLILLVIFRKKLKELDKENLKGGIILGLLYTVCMICEMTGLKTIETGTSSFIENTAVVIVPFYELILFKVLPKKITIISAFITLIGVGFLTLTGDATINVGILFAIAAALSYGACIMYTTHVANTCDPIIIGILQLGSMGLVCMILSFVFESPTLPQSSNQWAMLLMLVLVCSVFGFTFQPLAQKYMTATEAGMWATLNPLSACTIGILFAGEPYGVFKLLGGCLILLGIVMLIKGDGEK
ncbi:MAG: DMT family transporter [Eubacterium sp.]|nr:DMT family transporter [Eubacterium sp.]